MEKVIELINDLLESENLLAGTLSRPQNKRNPITRVLIRPVRLRGRIHYQLAYHEADKVKHRNLTKGDASEELIALLRHEYRQALLCSPEADYQLLISPGRKVKVLKRPPSKKRVSFSHNRRKKYIIPDNQPCSFLNRLGIMNQQGQVLPSRMNKFKQINRFLEMVDDIIDFLPSKQRLTVLDFGCGKSYLTFALYHYLYEQRGLDVEIIGLDLKEDVVRQCNRIAQDLQWAPRLSFWVGNIKDYQRTEHVDMVVSLHACDTATDVTLAKAVAWQSRVILAVPCCQHELRNKIENRLMRPLTKHGILKDRLAALITDALRASALEVAGYNVQVLEFIETEHTPKNLLIRAVRSQKGKSNRQLKKEYVDFRNAWFLKDPFIEKVFGSILK